MAVPLPLVSVYGLSGKEGDVVMSNMGIDSSSKSGVGRMTKRVGAVLMPSVFTSALRPDLVSGVHSLMMRNKRQAHGVSTSAGYQSSAESWGTGRAVSRIPRVQGGGTHRTGQGAFGNMCRGGGMFAPKKTWRRWQVRVGSVSLRRHAVATAVAAAAIPSLVMARGHRVEKLPELPLVVSDELMESISKTKDALHVLQSLGCGDDLAKVKDAKKVRVGRGKSRNRRYKIKKGPLIIHNSKTTPFVKACRNLPGIDSCHVNRLNLLKLAPGGKLGRLCIWSKSAFLQLQPLYDKTNSSKKYSLPKPMMQNADLNRIINSDEVQSVLNFPKHPKLKRRTQHPNPLKNKAALLRLNPAAHTLKKLNAARNNPKLTPQKSPKTKTST